MNTPSPSPSRSNLGRRLLLPLVVALGLLAVFGWWQFRSRGPDSLSASSEETVRVSALLPLTGPLASFGLGEQEAMKLALADYKGTKRHMEIVFEDHKGTGEQTAGILNRQLAQGIRFYVVSTSEPTQTALPKLRESGKDVIVFGQCMVSGITRGYDFAFRVYATSDQETDLLAAYARKQGFKHIAALRLNAPHAQEGVMLFSNKASASGIDIAPVEAFDKTERDLRSHIAKIKSSNPDAVLVYAFPHNFPVIFKQMEELGISVPILANSGMVLESLKDQVSDEFRSRIAFPAPHFSLGATTPQARAFSEAMRARGRTADWDMAFFYDMTQIILLALDRSASLDGPSVKRAIQELMPYDGVSGTIALTEDRDTRVNLKLARWTAGGLETVWASERE